MPIEIETRVMQLLSAIDGAYESIHAIEAMGSEAVTVVCEAALGSYPGIPSRSRKSAAALVGRLNHPQAQETLALLVRDSDPDIAIRAIRASGRNRRDDLVNDLGEMLSDGATPTLVAAEALKALAATGSPEAMEQIERYRRGDAKASAHRLSNVVRSVFRRIDAKPKRSEASP
ncbi:MAG: HEAT repeat domain-containing protein [Halioglobus sp.]|nr:HEAT repeat domain-containing protein [Halioglobus sp.]